VKLRESNEKLRATIDTLQKQLQDQSAKDVLVETRGTVRDSIAINENKQMKKKINQLEKRLSQDGAQKKCSKYTKKLAPKIPIQPIHNLYEYGKGDCVCNFNPLNTSELAKICRRIVAQGVFELTMPGNCKFDLIPELSTICKRSGLVALYHSAAVRRFPD